MISLAPPSQEGMGEAFLAPQGTVPAPPLQEGMGEASLVPQGAAPAPPLQKGMGEASLAPQGTPPLAAVAAKDNPTQQPRWRQRQQTAANRINNQQTTRSGGAVGLQGDDMTRDEECTQQSNRSCGGGG